MPSEAAITRMQDVLFDVIDLGGNEERTSIVPNLTVIDAAPVGLTNFIIVQDERDGDNILASTVPGVVYANNDKVNVLFIRGTEPIAFQQGSESTSANLWQIVPATSTDIFYNSGNVGIGASTPATLLEIEGSDPVLRLDDTSTAAGTYGEIQDVNQRLELRKVAASGVAQIIIDPRPDDNVSAATFRHFRNTNTAGAVSAQYFIGDGTGTISAQIGANNAFTYFDLQGDNVGIGTSAPAAALEIESANPTIRLDDTDTVAGSYSEISDVSDAMVFSKVSNAGAAVIRIDPFPVDGVAAALFRFFNVTNTAGLVGAQFFRGDGTGNVDANIGVNGANSYFGLNGGDTGVGIVPSGAKLHVDQSSTTAAIPVQILDQADVDEPFILFRGSAAAATLTRSIVAEADVTTATRQGFVKIEIDDVGNQVTDGDYYVPFFTLA